VRREGFNAKSRRRKDAKRFLTMPVRGAKRWILPMEPNALPDLSASWRLGVKVRLRRQSRQIKPNQTCGGGGRTRLKYEL
jgi:hypothetical protein